MDRLEQLGYDDWFQSHVDADLRAGHEVARVISVHRDRCAVTKGSGQVLAECSGNLLYSSDSPLDLPTTVTSELEALTPADYIGLAPRLAREI